MTLPTEPKATRARIIVPFTLVTLIWGATWLVIRDQLGVVPPSWSVCYRFIVAGLVLMAIALFRREKLRLDGPGWLFALALGIAQFALNFNFVYRAEAYITSGLVALVFALLVVPNAIFARIFLKQHLSVRFLVASAISIAGIALLFVHEARSDTSSVNRTLLGIGFTLLGVLSASVANVMQASRRAALYPMTVMLAWGMLIGAVVNASFAWTTVGPPVMDWRLGYVAGVVYLGAFGSALAFTLYYGIIRAIGPAMAAYTSILVPVIAMLLSTLFEDYHWSPLAAAGCVLGLAGLVMALRARRPVR